MNRDVSHDRDKEPGSGRGPRRQVVGERCDIQKIDELQLTERLRDIDLPREEVRGKKKKGELSIELIKEWVDAYRLRNEGRFPSTSSGPILNADGSATGEMWNGVNSLFRKAHDESSSRGLLGSGFTSLADFLNTTYPDERQTRITSIRTKREPPSLEQIKEWIDVYRTGHQGRFPSQESGPVFNANGSATGETWHRVDQVFRLAQRGKYASGFQATGFTSLSDFLDATYPRERTALVTVSVKEIREWVDAYRAIHEGRFPGITSGPILNADGSSTGYKWQSLNLVISRARLRGPAELANFTSLSDLVDNLYPDERTDRSEISVTQIRNWVSVYRKSHEGKFPNQGSGAIRNADCSEVGLTWRRLDGLLRESQRGGLARGLRNAGFASLRDLLDRSYPTERPVRTEKEDLTEEQIKIWVENYRLSNAGRFPNEKDGFILNADGSPTGETWRIISECLRSAQRGRRARGLKGTRFKSLKDLLDQTYPAERKVRVKQPDLSIEQIKVWVDSYRARNGGNFPTPGSGIILNVDGSETGGSWRIVDQLFRSALNGGRARGLKGTDFSSLHDFLDRTYPGEREVRVLKSELSLQRIKLWVDVYRATHSGRFPNINSGAILNADGGETGDSWEQIDDLFRLGHRGGKARGLKGCGFKSLGDFLRGTYPGEGKFRVVGPPLSIEQIREWVDVYRATNKGRFPAADSGRVFNSDGSTTEETWGQISSLFKQAYLGSPARGLRGSGFSTFANFLDNTYPAERRNRGELTLEQIRIWVDVYRASHEGKFPSAKRREAILNADGSETGENWRGVATLFTQAHKGFPARGLAGNPFKSFKIFLDRTYPAERLDTKRLYAHLVSSWSGPEEALTWAASERITTEQLTTYVWLTTLAKKPREEGGVGKNLRHLLEAILERFGTIGDFKVWLSGRDPRTEPEILRELFAGPEAQALRNLAETLGDAALAEYLVAAYPDKFLNYNAELVENLRPYLGEIERTSRVMTDGELPEAIFSLEKLSHLRQAVFNWYRDSYQPIFAQGLVGVIARLQSLRDKSHSECQSDFIQSLIEYFSNVGALPHPSRLKKSLNGEQLFPAAHQRMAMYETTQSRRILLGDEMGGGKTGSAIGSFELLREEGKAKRCLIICPSKVVLEWKRALQDSGDKPYFKQGSAPSVVFIDQESKDWDAAAKADYTVISLEMTRSQSQGSPIAEKLKHIDFDFLIFDEAHNAKNAKRNKSDAERVFAISRSPTLREGYLMLLTGTPIPNTLRDLAAHLRLLYADTDEVSSLDVTNLKELSKTIIRSHPLMVRNLLVRKMMRRKTEDCLPVGCDYHREQVAADLSPVSQALYTSIVEDPFLSATEKIAALRRCCLDAKFDAVCAAIDKALHDEKYRKASSPPKIVVAESSYAKGITRNRKDARESEESGRETYLYSRLRSRYGENMEVFVLDRLNSRDRAEVLKQFRNCPKPACLLTLTSVSGEGIDISCAADGILISPTYTVSSEQQFIRRLVRSGQKLPVRLQILFFSNTIEEGVLGYSASKHRVVASVMDGRPLTSRERAILKDDFSQVRKHGPIAYESFTPRQQALWILRKMKQVGKEGISKFLRIADGKYAKDFARGYPVDEHTSVSGNTARLVAAVIDRLSAPRQTRPLVVADIACGCRTLERMFEGARDIVVRSLDINEAALIAGAQLLHSPVETRSEEVGAMDALPFADGSVDIGVISLALDMTKHSKGSSDGQERIRTLLELNRVLTHGGRAIITFPESLFPTNQDFERFLSGIEQEYGFTRCAGFTGLATAYNASEREKFAAWMITLEKTKHVYVDDIDLGSRDTWERLHFPRIASHAPKRHGVDRQPAQKQVGAYQDAFSIAGTDVTFTPSTMRQCEVAAAQQQERLNQQRLQAKIQALIQTYRNIKDIPAELLLSITPEQIGKATQEERDQFYRLQIEKFGSEDQIPTTIINEKNGYILVRQSKKLKDGGKKFYLCLAKVTRDGKSWGPTGTRYFYD